MERKKNTLVSCCVVLLVDLLIPVCSHAAEVKVITPVLLLLLGGGSANGGTCTSGPQTVNYGGHEWQRCDDGLKYNWDEANAYCANLTLDGHSDWRLPAKDELKSLVVCTNGTQTPLQDNPKHPSFCGDGNSTPYNYPTIDTQFSCRSVDYWSSSVYDADDAWYVNFTVGTAHWNYRLNNTYVRCVR
jgi:hypothetical protein